VAIGVARPLPGDDTGEGPAHSGEAERPPSPCCIVEEKARRHWFWSDHGEWRVADVAGRDYRVHVKRIAIAGGIGAGKTALSNRLAALGYSVIDADDIAHQITEKGSPALQALRDAFGDAVLNADGSLDRSFVAEVVFHDASALRRLNSITHGHIGAEIVRQLEQASGEVVFVALPLFRPEHRAVFGFDEAWAVQADPRTAVRRLCDFRGYSREEARARMAQQMTNEERAAIVDRVIWNEGSLVDLYAQVDEALRESGVVRG
jgi:dephospho-CoA kinase